MSHIASLTVLSSIVKPLTLKSTPIVADWSGSNLSSVNLNSKLQKKKTSWKIYNLLIIVMKRSYSGLPQNQAEKIFLTFSWNFSKIFLTFSWLFTKIFQTFLIQRFLKFILKFTIKHLKIYIKLSILLYYRLTVFLLNSINTLWF